MSEELKTREKLEEEGRQAWLDGIRSPNGVNMRAPIGEIERRHFIRGWRQMKDAAEADFSRARLTR